VVTLLTVPPPEFELELVFEVEVESAVVVGVESAVVVVVVVVVVPDAAVLADELLAASAGSCPDTSTIEISSHAATNSASDPATIRRRIMRTRASRALLIAWPRARGSCGLLSVMVEYLVVGSIGQGAAGGSFGPAHSRGVRNG
jgi:hypothetical protein